MGILNQHDEHARHLFRQRYGGIGPNVRITSHTQPYDFPRDNVGLTTYYAEIVSYLVREVFSRGQVNYLESGAGVSTEFVVKRLN